MIVGSHDFYQREDDKPETVKNRLAVNIKSSEPILAYYKEKGLLQSIDGDRDIDAVFKDVKTSLTNHRLPVTDLQLQNFLLKPLTEYDKICQSDFYCY